MDVEHRQGKRNWLGVAFGSTVLMLVAFAVVWALVVVGTPQTARMKKLDRARVDDLQNIRFAIERFYREHEMLPISLEQLEYLDESLTDPATDEPYGYQVTESQAFELSANFSLADDERSWRGNWKHPAGAHSFSFEVPEVEQRR